MPRHRNLNLQKFLDSVPKVLIEEYFKHRLGDRINTNLKAFDFNSVNKFLESDIPEEQSREILEDFTQINDICEKVMNILVQAINHYSISTSGNESKEELAMRIFLRHPDAFDYAYDYYCLYNSTHYCPVKIVLIAVPGHVFLSTFSH